MDAIFNWFQKIFEILFVKSALAHFQWVDWITVAFVFVGIIYGSRKGMMREIVEILEMIVIVTVALSFHKKLMYLFTVYLSFFPDASVPAVSFILLALSTWALIAFLDGHVKKMLHAQMAPALKAVGGALLGAVHFLLICSFVIQGVLALPIAKIRRSYDAGHSYTGEFIQKLAPKISRTIQEPILLIFSKE